MGKPTRDVAIKELKRLVGQTDPDGTPHLDPDEIIDPEVLATFSQPSPEKIKALAARMVARKAH